jgi:hypothetical protein
MSTQFFAETGRGSVWLALLVSERRAAAVPTAAAVTYLSLCHRHRKQLRHRSEGVVHLIHSSTRGFSFALHLYETAIMRLCRSENQLPTFGVEYELGLPKLLGNGKIVARLLTEKTGARNYMMQACCKLAFQTSSWLGF